MGREQHSRRLSPKGVEPLVSTLPTKEALVAEGTAALEDLPTDVLIAAVQTLKAMRSGMESGEVRVAIADLIQRGGWGSINLQYQEGRLVGVDCTVKKRPRGS